MDESQNIIPNPRGLFFALRSSGYSNEAAIADLIDNSLDAGAKNVKVFIDNLKTIYIADDGSGMSFDTLKQAIILGGKKTHDSADDLGKYGLGLITASLSLGRKIRIITKFDGDYHTAVFDYDTIEKNNTFNAVFRESTEEEKSSFDYRTDNTITGTVLIIDNCDKIKYRTANDLATALKESVKNTFRAFMRDGRNIYINDDVATYADPLFLDDAKTRKLVNKDVSIKSSDGKETGKLHILAVALPEFERNLASKLGININNQGFYILRNKREIASAVEFPEVFKKHNDYNYLRIEVDFNSALDDLMGINYTKHNAVPSKEIVNVLKTELASTFELMRKESRERAERNKAKRQANQFRTELSAEAVSGANPTAAATAKPKNGTVSTPLPGQKTLPLDEAKNEPKELKVEFSTRFKTEGDPLFEASIEGEKMVVRYNGASNYFKDQVLASEQNTQLKEQLDKMLEATVKSCFANKMPVKQIADVLNGIAKEM